MDVSGIYVLPAEKMSKSRLEAGVTKSDRRGASYNAYFVTDTRRFNSSDQFCTTTIL